MSNTTEIFLPVIAVDQGYWAQKIALGRGEDGVIAVSSFPSYVASVPGPHLLDLPGIEKPMGVVVEVGGAYYYSGEDVLGAFKTPRQRKVDPNWVSSADYKALFLSALAHVARHHRAQKRVVISLLVLGLPYASAVNHASTLVRMARLVHTVPGIDGPVEVEVRQVMVVAQPQGGMYLAVAKRGTGGRELNIVTTDMGGGTFDWLYGRGIKLTRDRCGSTPYGTLALAEAAARAIDPDLVNNPLALERIDHALRHDERSVRLNATTFSLDQCWPAIDKVLDDAWTQLDKAIDNWVVVDLIHVTGGGAGLTVRMLKRHLAKLSPDFLSLLEQGKDPHTENVRGFLALGETELERASGSRTSKV